MFRFVLSHTLHERFGKRLKLFVFLKANDGIMTGRVVFIKPSEVIAGLFLERRAVEL